MPFQFPAQEYYIVSITIHYELNPVSYYGPSAAVPMGADNRHRPIETTYSLSYCELHK
ncbi:hypothetical protein ACSS6W_000897 [Trichoderma asperelloides]